MFFSYVYSNHDSLDLVDIAGTTSLQCTSQRVHMSTILQINAENAANRNYPIAAVRIKVTIINISNIFLLLGVLVVQF